MPEYCVNDRAQPGSGDHEVHKEGCRFWPANRTDLGSFITCEPAVRAAKQYYPDSNGCLTCSPACHTT